MKISRECHKHEAEPSRGTKRRRDEKQWMAKQKSHMKHRQTNKEELQQRNRFGTFSRKTTVRGVRRVLKPVLFARTLTLNSDVTPNSKPLRKYAYSNIKKISPPKTENVQVKNSDIFHICAQNIDCGYSLEPPRRGGSNEYPQSMFWAEIRKNMYTPLNPSFTI